MVISDHGCGDGLITGTWLLHQQSLGTSITAGITGQIHSTENEKLAMIFRADVESAKIIVSYRSAGKIGYNLSVQFQIGYNYAVKVAVH